MIIPLMKKNCHQSQKKMEKIKMRKTLSKGKNLKKKWQEFKLFFKELMLQ